MLMDALLRYKSVLKYKYSRQYFKNIFRRATLLFPQGEMMSLTPIKLRKET